MRKARILIVDDEPDILSGLKIFLTYEGFSVKTVERSEELMKEVKDFSPDLILMDIMLGDTSGYELKKQLNRNINTAGIPVVFISVNRSLEHKRRGYREGAQDDIVKPFDMDELVTRIEAVLTRKKFYENMYMKDSLTELCNRPHFEKQAKILYSMSTTYSRAFSIAVININGMKTVNKIFGRDAGDFLLKSVADMIRGTRRNMDIATRYDADEFIVLLPETDRNQASAFLNRIRKIINNRVLKYKETKKINFSISAGSSTCTSGELNLEKMFTIADLSMYVEKALKVKPCSKDVLIIEDEEGIAKGMKLELEAEGFTVKDILYKFKDAVNYIEKTSEADEPAFVILDLDLEGRLSPDFLGQMYSKWKVPRVYIFTAYPEYLDIYPYFRDIVCGVFTKSQLHELISSLK